MKYILTLMLITFFNHASASQTQSLNNTQQRVKQIARDVGSKNCVDDICFTKTLQAIAWQESNFGSKVIGDSKGISYFYLHNNKIVHVRKEETFIRDGVRYAWYQPKRNKYIKQVYMRNGSKPIEHSSLGSFQIKVSTAKEVITKMNLVKYNKLLNNEQSLVSKLLTDHHFGAIIAVNYLKMLYVNAKNNGVNDPYYRAISRYNGGNFNNVYVDLILTKVQQL